MEFSPDVLQGKGRVRQGWSCGAGSEEERSSRSTQASGQDVGLRRAAARFGHADPRTRTCSDGPGEILCRGPSKNYRACANYKKNSSVTPCNVGYGPTSRDIVERYETLRAAALGGGLPFDARSGLALFLRRGMWGWAEAATTPETLVHSRRPIASRMNSDEHQILSQLFASMVMSISQRRTNEHISQSSIAPSRA